MKILHRILILIIYVIFLIIYEFYISFFCNFWFLFCFFSWGKIFNLFKALYNSKKKRLVNCYFIENKTCEFVIQPILLIKIYVLFNYLLLFLTSLCIIYYLLKLLIGSIIAKYSHKYSLGRFNLMTITSLVISKD